jgi:hypothetical protein
MVDTLVKRIASGIPIEEQTIEFRNICRALARNGAMCELHKKEEPGLENCTICIDGRFDV